MIVRISRFSNRVTFNIFMLVYYQFNQTSRDEGNSIVNYLRSRIFFLCCFDFWEINLQINYLENKGNYNSGFVLWKYITKVAFID